jgi:TolB-like protein/Tfp pilus assembly protein PilF
MSFYEELNRRNVAKVAVLYIIAAWLILQVADVLFDAMELPSTWVRLVLAIIILGFPLALIFSWVYEMTPEGLKKEKDIDRSQSITPDTGRKVNVLIIVMLALAIGAVVVDRLIPESTPVADNRVIDGAVETKAVDPATLAAMKFAPAAERSIAVLPFVNMSADEENEFFADGLSEELLNVLARIKDFKVAGRTSSFAFKGKNEDFKMIGEALNVKNILEGSVRKSGDTVRVTAQLIEVSNGYHLWSDTYDRKLDNIFEIQDEIATQVVAALKQELLGASDQAVIAKKSTENIEAYQHYLKGLHHVAYRSREQLELALAEFREAARIDSNYALAHTGIAYVYVMQASYAYRSIAEVGPLAELSIEKAFAIDDQLSEAWAIKAQLLSGMGAPDSEKIPLLERAIALNPNNAYAYMWLASSFFASDSERMWELYNKAYELDPLAPVIVQNMATYTALDGDMEKAAYYADQLKEIAPNWDGTYRTSSSLAMFQGNMEQEIRSMHKVLELDPESITTYETLAGYYTLLGDLEQAQALIDKGRRLNPAYGGIAASEAGIQLLQGNKEAAVQLMQAMVRKWPEDKTLLRDAARIEAFAGNLQQANDLYLRSYGYQEYPSEWAVDSNKTFDGSLFAYVIYQLGDTETAVELSESIQGFFAGLAEQGRQFWLIGSFIANAAAAVQDREGALSGLRLALDQGMTAGPIFRLNPVYDFLRDDPEYLALSQELERRRKAVVVALAKDGLIVDTTLAQADP